MTDPDDLRNLIRRHHRRLQLLKEQQASFGPLHTPVHILTQIEDTETEIHKLQAELAAIESGADTLTQRVEAQRRRIAEGLDELRQQTAVSPAFEQRQIWVVGRPPLGTVEHFKDRVRECEKIGELLASPSTRLVSVIGHGGMGKTALASKILRDLEQHRWPHTEDDIPLDGIAYLSTRTAGISLERLFLDCAKLFDGETGQQLNAIWINPKLSTTDKVTRLLDVLNNGQYVILLDNMEDLLDDAGRLTDEDLRLFFDQSLTQAHGVRLLVTSRLSLTFQREVVRFDQQVKLLDGLPEADGVALLQELDPNGDYGLREAEDEELAQAVRLVHGVPRALEVIAGILANDPFASLDEVMVQFYEQEDVVEALIEENYKRLDDNARRVIEALAVFKRPVSPLAVDYLLEPFVPGLDVPNIIRRLTHTNIASVDRATKTIALHPIDQDYAYSQLPEKGTGEIVYTRQALERRAADYYAQLRAPEESWQTIDDLEPQLAEFEHRCRAGDYDSAGRLLNSIDADYLYLWGYYARLGEMRKKLIGKLSSPTLQTANLESLGRAYCTLGQVNLSIKFYEEALTIARKTGDRQREGSVLGNLGISYDILGQYYQAIKLYEQALYIARELGDRTEEGRRLSNLSSAYNSLGQPHQAIKLCEQALDLMREPDVGDRQREAALLDQLGWFHQVLGQIEHAIDLSEAALDIAREVGDRRREGLILGGLSSAYLYLGQVDQGISFRKQALTIAREIGDRRFEGQWSSMLGSIYLGLGQIEQSIKIFKQSLSIAREINYYLGEGAIFGELGMAYFTLGQTNRAIEFYEQGLVIARDINMRRLESRLLGYLGRAYYALGQFEQAIEFQEQALLISREMSDRQSQSIQLLNLGKVLQTQGELSEAQRHYAEALALDVPMINYRTTLALAIVRLHQGDPTSDKIFSDAARSCQTLLKQTYKLYEPCYILATALTGQAICNLHWVEAAKRPELLAPTLAEYQRALDICAAPGVVQDAIRDLELIQAAGIEGLEPVFELLTSVIKKQA